MNRLEYSFDPRTLGLVEHLPEILDELRRAPALFLESAPGSGKTTLVPPAILDSGETPGKILVLQPRRVAAWAVAQRMADVRGEPVGKTVGYRVRGDTKVGDSTRIEVITEGILLRMLGSDPFLEGVGAVVFDEFHERSIDSDLALSLIAEIKKSVRPDLLVVVMSATLGSIEIERVFPEAARLRFDARRFPVTVEHRDYPPAGPSDDDIVREIKDELRTPGGDILVFLPGAGEIERIRDRIDSHPTAAILPLYGDLSYDEQRRAILPGKDGKRRVILSTSIAETSVTIEGVEIVLDSGFVKTPRFDPGTGLTRLSLERVTRAQAEQRAGRAGRTAPGRCIRLWPEYVDRGLRAASEPEILEGDLAPLALALAAWGTADLHWIDPPPTAALAQARALLGMLGALDEAGAVTELGRSMAGLGVHPRIGRILLRARSLGASRLGADVAAILEERDPFSRKHFPGIDLGIRLDALEELRRSRRAPLGADRRALERINRNARSHLERLGGRESSTNDVDHGVLIASGYPDRIAQRRPDGRFLLSQGRGARLPADDRLAGRDFLVAASIADRERDAIIQLGAELDPRDFDGPLAELVRTGRRTSWEGEQGSIRSVEERRVGAIVLSEKRLSDLAPEECAALIADRLRSEGGAKALPWGARTRALRSRLMLAHAHLSGGFPDLSDPAIDERFDDLVVPYLAGFRRKGDITEAWLETVLRAAVPPQLFRRLDDELPEELTLRGAKTRRIDYTSGELPILEATVQELLGLSDTPRLGGGSIALVLHILSPARRPMQVTRDLAAFWKNTYPEVRKELRGRYPKHRWPEDPLE